MQVECQTWVSLYIYLEALVQMLTMYIDVGFFRIYDSRFVWKMPQLLTSELQIGKLLKTGALLLMALITIVMSQEKLF